MKSINIKKAATIAVGTAMLAGAAFAVSTEAADPTFYWDADGNVNTQIVVGANAQDGVQAAKFAAFLGKNAYVETGEGGEQVTKLGSEIGADCSVTVEQTSGGVVLPEESVKQDLAWATDLDENNRLLLTTSQDMMSGTIEFDPDGSGDQEYDYEESAGLPYDDDAVTLAYAEDEDYHGVYFDDIDSKQFYYEFEFLDAFPTDASMDETVSIPFLGEEYVINDIDTGEIELVKGTQIDLGVGGKRDVSIGNDTYTVTLENVGFNAQTDTGTATINVVKGTDSKTVKLDTGESTVVLGLNVFVESTEESYVTGIQGTATMRVGGAAVTLEDGEAFPLDDDWVVDLELDSSDDLSKILLFYDKEIEAEDEVVSISGPNDYFYLEYLGTQIDPDWNNWDTEEVVVNGGEMGDDDEGVITKITYTETNYEKEYEVDLNDKDGAIAFFASNGTGFIGNATGNNPGNLTQGDIFFVKDTPVRVDGVTETSVANSKVSLTIGEGIVSGTENDMDVKKSSGDNAGNDSDFAWTTVSILGEDVTIKWSYTGDLEIAQVLAGADTDIDTQYDAVIDWDDYDDTAFDDTGRDMTAVDLTVVVDEGAGNTLTFMYDNGTDDDDPGINMTDDGGQVINQATSNGDHEDNIYEWDDDYRAEATGSGEVTVWIPEQAPFEKRVTLTRSEINTAGSNGTMTYDYDEVPAGVVEGMTCMAKDYTYTLPAGVTFGQDWSITSLVILDDTTPSGNAVVIGGHFANKMAEGVTDDALAAAGDTYVEKSGTNVYAAGYTAADTESAIDELIDAIKTAKMA